MIRDGESILTDAVSDRYRRRVLSFCQSLLRNPEDALDACQDVFLTVVRKREELPSIRRLTPWIMRIALLTCLYVRRQRGKAVHLDSEMDIDTPVDPGPPIRDRENMQKVYAAIEQLSDRDRAVLTLHYQQQLPQEEIAEVIGVSRGAIRVILHRAVARLRQHVREADGCTT